MWLQWRCTLFVSKSTTIRARIEPVLKAEVDSILGKLGLTASETIHLLYRQIQLRRGLPFEVTIPTPLTAKVLKESKTGKNVRHFASKRELYADPGTKRRFQLCCHAERSPRS
jgi:DNA-damage-inducible protein J